MRFGQSADQEGVTLELTPLIDVVLLLVLFFMVTSTFQDDAELQVDLPQATADAASQRPDPLELRIRADGTMMIDGRRLERPDLPTLKAALREAAGDGGERLVIAADRATAHEQVVLAMDAARQAGLLRLGFRAAALPDAGSPDP